MAKNVKKCIKYLPIRIISDFVGSNTHSAIRTKMCGTFTCVHAVRNPSAKTTTSEKKVKCFIIRDAPSARESERFKG